MSEQKRRLSRREALSGLVVLPALAGFFAAGGAIAEAKGSKTQFKYQSQPKGNQQCSKCRFFHAGKTANAMGTCDIVAGGISPKGWCTAFAAK